MIHLKQGKDKKEEEPKKALITKTKKYHVGYDAMVRTLDST
jgi:hypothetical protein